LPATVVWTVPESEVVTALINALDTLDEADHEALILEVNRIIALSDEAGQNALQDVDTSTAMFDAVEGGHNFLPHRKKVRVGPASAHPAAPVRAPGGRQSSAPRSATVIADGALAFGRRMGLGSNIMGNR
jgi:hypothetical protein